MPLPHRLAQLSQSRRGGGHGGGGSTGSEFFSLDPESRLLPDIGRHGGHGGNYVPGLIEVTFLMIMV